MGIFQRVREGVPEGLERAIVYIDDILVVGAKEKEHLKRLDDVLSHLEEVGLRAQKKKTLVHGAISVIPWSKN